MKAFTKLFLPAYACLILILLVYGFWGDKPAHPSASEVTVESSAPAPVERAESEPAQLKPHTIYCSPDGRYGVTSSLGNLYSFSFYDSYEMAVKIRNELVRSWEAEQAAQKLRYPKTPTWLTDADVIREGLTPCP